MKTRLLVLMALSCIPTQAHQMEPDSTWWVSPDTLCWTPVAGAEGYQVYQELLVSRLDDGPPKLHRMNWASAAAGENCASIGHIDGDRIPYGVEVLHAHATAVRLRTWGEVKANRG